MALFNNTELVELMREMVKEEIAYVEDSVVERVNDEITHVASDAWFLTSTILILLASFFVVTDKVWNVSEWFYHRLPSCLPKYRRIRPMRA